MRYVPFLAAAVAMFVAGCGGGGPAGIPSGTGSISGVVSTTTTFATRVPVGRIDARVGLGVRRSPARAPRMVPDQVLVKFRPGVYPTQAAESHRLAGGVELKRFARTGLTLVRITSGDSVDTVLSRYRRDPRVAYAEPNYLRYLAATPPRTPQATPNDPGYPFQWHYANINLPAAWDITTGSSLVIVAVVDSGILFNHADLANVTVSGFDFVDNDSNPADPGCPTASDLSHGTHVAGTVAAATNNAIGVTGVNWGGAGKTKIMPLRIFGNFGGQCTVGTADDVIDAIEWAADHSARVINMSFGGPGFSQAEQDAVTYAFSTGVVLVAAVGNDDANCANVYPAAYANVIGVAATTITNAKAFYSNFGSCVDLAAPGGDTTTDLNTDGFADGVLSTEGTVANPTQYIFEMGTSMAAPHVAGVAALLVSKGVTGPANVQNVMQTTATDLGAAGYDTTFGWGLINAAAAVGAPAALNPMKVFGGTISGNAITRSSDVVSAAPNGAYTVTNVQSGTWTVFAWQDTNGNGVIDGSDLYGSIGGVVVGAGGTTTNVNLTVKEVPVDSTPITVSAALSGAYAAQPFWLGTRGTLCT